jgi:hypothetical protein
VSSLVLILSLLSAAPSDPQAVSAGDVLACDFEDATDRDYDRWPDQWIRERSRDLPEFLKIGIVREPPGTKVLASGAAQSIEVVNHALEVELDGGGAIIASPPKEIHAQFSLFLTARIKTQGLKHDAAWVELQLIDAEGRVLQSHSTTPLTHCPDWQSVQVGPLTAIPSSATHAIVRLQVGPLGKRDDLKGQAWFDDLRLQRLPRMQLLASTPTGILAKRDVGPLTCAVSGIRIKNPRVRFELFDHRGQRLADSTSALVMSEGAGAPEKRLSRDGYAGQTTWSPPVNDYGYYRVQASLLAPGSDEALLSRSQSLAVLRSLPQPQHSEYGWSLQEGEEPLAYGNLATLLGQAGLGWAKMPVWYDPQQTAQADRIAWFAEQLSIQGIELVGVLDQPPAELRAVFREQGRLPAASVFAEPELWQPAVGPVMTRLSLKVHWWQLGHDGDVSFVGYPQLETKLQEIKRNLQQYGQQIQLGINWRWIFDAAQPSATKPAPWSFLSYSSEPQLTADELAAYLSLKSKQASSPSKTDRGANRSAPSARPTMQNASASSKVALRRGQGTRAWMLLSPLPENEYSQEIRIRDLVQRLLASKIYGASAIFLPEPFSEQEGIMNGDGSPGPLFVPWRTTAMLVGGAEYLGPLPLPGGATGHMFGRDGHAVMAVWSDHPVIERVFLGADVEQLDVWGRATKPAIVEMDGRRVHELSIRETPTFITGLSEAVARWQAAVNFTDPRLASVAGREQIVTLTLKNTFAQGIHGELSLHAPKNWGFDPRPMRFKIAEGEELRLPIPVTLMPDANSGSQPVRLDFDVGGQRFSVHRSLQLGLDDVQVEMTSRLKNGALLVEQHLTNLSDHPLSFQCVLFAPGRRRETRQIINLGRDRTTLVFVLPEGEELIGQKLWLRAEEIGGPRVLNYTLQAER